MPELPEVETTLRGIRPHLEGRILKGVTVLVHHLGPCLLLRELPVLAWPPL